MPDTRNEALRIENKLLLCIWEFYVLEEFGECVVPFTQQQVDQDLLSSQSVAPCETHDSANDPRDAVPRER